MRTILLKKKITNYLFIASTPSNVPKEDQQVNRVISFHDNHFTEKFFDVFFQQRE